LRLLVEDDVAGDGPADNMDVDISAAGDSEMSSPLSEVKSEPDASISTRSKRKGTPPLRNVIHTPDGKIIVETLDTPALRRQKSLNRKAERLRLAAEAEAASASSAGPSQLPVFGSGSSLTDLDGDEEETEKPSNSIIVAPPQSPPKDPAVVDLAEGETLEGGTLGTYRI
jgi:NuA3 HAT complex component NTO1